MADRMKEVADARRELVETLAFSDAWLVGIIVGFAILGNTYRIRKRYEVYVGMALFSLCFGVYVFLKSWEKQRAVKAKAEKENAEKEAAEKQSLQEESQTKTDDRSD